MINEQFLFWITERHKITLRRAQGIPKPWTADPVLRGYRFCNVHREDDTVTRWIADHWRTPHKKDPDLWFHMAVARLVNWPETLEEIGAEDGWDPEHFVSVLETRKAAGLKVFSGAYIVSTNGHTQPKARYLAEHVLTPLWRHRAAIRPHKQDTLASFHERLWGHNGMGSFMAAQVVADVKYVEPLSKAADWWTWAASGPGSRRGLNRVLYRDKNAPWREADWLRNLQMVQEHHTHVLEQDHGVPRLHAQDFQNCCCEFDKWMRTKLGEGRPRSKYPGGK